MLPELLLLGLEERDVSISVCRAFKNEKKPAQNLDVLLWGLLLKQYLSK